jgi:FdhE protein
MNSQFIEAVMAADGIENLAEKVEALRKRWPFYREMLEWLAMLLDKSMRMEEHIRLPSGLISKAGAVGFPALGKPLFTIDRLPLDAERTAELFVFFVEEADKRRGDGSNDFQLLLKQAGPDILSWVRKAFESDSGILQLFCQDTTIDPKALWFLLRLSARPSLRVLSRTARKTIHLDQWSHSYCPVCGSMPFLAELKAESAGRLLYCCLCETAWLYPRSRCPFCEKEGPDAMDYQYAEGEEGVRFYYCKSCGLNLKTIDPSCYPIPVIPILDDVATTHLTLAVESHRDVFL